MLGIKEDGSVDCAALADEVRGEWEELSDNQSIMSCVCDAFLYPLKLKEKQLTDEDQSLRSSDEATSRDMIRGDSNTGRHCMVPTMLAVALFLHRKNNSSDLVEKAWKMLASPKVLDMTAKSPIEYGNLLRAMTELVIHNSSQNSDLVYDAGCVSVLLHLHESSAESKNQMQQNCFPQNLDRCLAEGLPMCVQASLRALSSQKEDLEMTDHFRAQVTDTLIDTYSISNPFENDKETSSRNSEALAAVLLLVEKSDKVDESCLIRKQITRLIGDQGQIIEVVLKRIIQLCSDKDDKHQDALATAFLALYNLAKQSSACSNGKEMHRIERVQQSYAPLRGLRKISFLFE
jgi:hypothetical protein